MDTANADRQGSKEENTSMLHRIGFAAPAGIAFLMLIAGCSKTTEYPLQTVEQAKNSRQSQGWHLVEVLGDQQGPYRLVNSGQLNKGASNRSIRYTMNGKELVHDLDMPEECVYEGFENPAGNALVLVFTKTEGPTTKPAPPRL
jgi:hypothetical protein